MARLTDGTRVGHQSTIVLMCSDTTKMLWIISMRGEKLRDRNGEMAPAPYEGVDLESIRQRLQSTESSNERSSLAGDEVRFKY